MLIGLFGGGDDDDDVEDGDVDEDDDVDDGDEDDDVDEDDEDVDEDDDASEVVAAMMWLRIQSPTDDKVTLRVTCSFGTLVIAIIPIGKNIVYV